MLVVSYCIIRTVFISFFNTADLACCSVFVFCFQILCLCCIGYIYIDIFVFFDDFRCFVACEINCDRRCCCDLICFTIVCNGNSTFGCHRLECRIFLIICNVWILSYRNHQVAVLFCDRIFCHADLACYVCISGRITDTDDVIAVFHHVCCLVCIIRSHLCCIVCDRQYLRFSRCQLICLCIACQFLIRFIQIAFRG